MKRSLSIIVLFFVLPMFLFSVSCSKKVKATPPPAQATTDTSTQDKAKEDEEARKRQLEAEELEKQKKLEAEKQAARDQFMNDDIHFDFDKSNIRSEDQEILKKKAEFMKANADAAVSVEGHCDERGTAEYNMALGDKRANAAKTFMVDLGIEASRMDTISYGKEKPADQGHGEDAWAKNRRAHFLIK